MVSGSLIKLPWSTKQYVTGIHFRNHDVEINAANGKMNQAMMVNYYLANHKIKFNQGLFFCGFPLVV